MYGGRGSFNEYFDQVYVLSIPSFTWTKVSEGSIPRYGHTCHVAGNRQMLSVGGTSSSRNCDHVYSGVAVFDMSTMLWVNSYNASATPYVVPDPVVSKIGGS